MSIDPTTPELADAVLDRCVHALAEGDRAFFVSLVTHAGHALAAALVAEGGGAVARLDPVALDALVHEVAVLVADRAPAQVPLGVPPVQVVQRAAADVLADRAALEGPRVPAPERVLHLVDIENLAGGPQTATTVVHHLWRQYQVVAGRRAEDLVMMAAELALYRRIAFALSGAGSLRPATGPDGADRRLLGAAPAEWVVQRFDRLVIGSGDHAFADLAAAVRACGVQVVVVAVPGCLSGVLARSADEVRWLDRPGARLLERATRRSGVARAHEQPAWATGPQLALPIQALRALEDESDVGSEAAA